MAQKRTSGTSVPRVVFDRPGQEAEEIPGLGVFVPGQEYDDPDGRLMATGHFKPVAAASGARDQDEEVN